MQTLFLLTGLSINATHFFPVIYLVRTRSVTNTVFIYVSYLKSEMKCCLLNKIILLNLEKILLTRPYFLVRYNKYLKYIKCYRNMYLDEQNFNK